MLQFKEKITATVERSSGDFPLTTLEIVYPIRYKFSQFLVMNTFWRVTLIIFSIICSNCLSSSLVATGLLLVDNTEHAPCADSLTLWAQRQIL
jgi:hypothetical protein